MFVSLIYVSCLAGASGVDFETVGSHWGVCWLPQDASLQFFWCLEGLASSLWGLVRCRLRFFRCCVFVVLLGTDNLLQALGQEIDIDID